MEKAIELLNWAEELLERDNRPEAESWFEAVNEFYREEQRQGRVEI